MASIRELSQVLARAGASGSVSFLRRRRLGLRGRALDCLLGVTVASGVFLPSVAVAGSCVVPGTHASLQAAVDDGSCETIELTDSHYFAGATVDRSVVIFGSAPNGTRVLGTLEALAGSEVSLADLTFDSGGPQSALLASEGGVIFATNVRAVQVGQLFVDGFETGTTVAWSSTTPLALPAPPMPVNSPSRTRAEGSSPPSTPLPSASDEVQETSATRSNP